MTSRYLITTADESTWKFDRPVIFLGEWCRIYDRRHIWESMDATVAEPYGVDFLKKDADYAEARALEEKIFPVLCNVLNQYHGLMHGQRFWKILIGHWFRRNIEVILNRFNTLEQCHRSILISGTTAYDTKHYSLASQDSISAVWSFLDARWNSVLNARIIDFLVSGNYPIEFIASSNVHGFSIRSVECQADSKLKSLKWLYRKVMSFASYFARDSDAFIINTYLPKKNEIKLQLALGQCPQNWVSPELKITEVPDIALRKELSNKIKRGSDNKLEEFLYEIIFELLPVCYLEGFSSLNKVVRNQVWPSKPKFIFTSNNFDTDEVFKLWTAKKTELGVNYVVGQHGNNYGTYRYMAPAIEEQIADKFLTWGWMDRLPQHVPAFIFKNAGIKPKNYNASGGVVLIELCYGGQISTWDRYYEFEIYIKEQLNFVGNLENEPKNLLTVRLYQPLNFPMGCEVLRWNDFDSKLHLEYSKNIRELISQSRLVVYSYDSTGILETLSQNIPTLAFWQNGLDHLRESAKPFYQLLIDAGIVHLTSESAAQKVNEVWNDVDGWWKQSKVQDARKRFCEQYARQSLNPIKDLKLLLSDN